MNAEPRSETTFSSNRKMYVGWGSCRDTSMVSGQGRESVAMYALVEEGEFIPDMERRNIMNLVLLFGGVAPAVGGLAVPYVLFFVPRTSGGGGAGLVAKTKAGDDITLKSWMTDHRDGDRQLV